METTDNEHFDFVVIRRDIRQRLGELQDSIISKYCKNKSLNRVTEELIAQSIYRVLEYYNFSKADTHSISSKFVLKAGRVLEDVKASSGGYSVNEVIRLDNEFKPNIEDFVDKRMRPFLQKKDFLGGKIKDMLK